MEIQDCIEKHAYFAVLRFQPYSIMYVSLKIHIQFQHPNSEDLIVRLSEAELAENPKIIAVISYQSPSQIEIAVDLVLKTKQKRP